MGGLFSSVQLFMTWRLIWFGRLSKPLNPERSAFPKVGKKFRYSGRTQQQVAGSTDADRPAPVMQRSGRPIFQARGPTDTVNTTGKIVQVGLHVSM